MAAGDGPHHRWTTMWKFIARTNKRHFCRLFFEKEYRPFGIYKDRQGDERSKQLSANDSNE